MKIFCVRNRRGSGMILALFGIMLLFTLGISYLMAGSSSLMAARRDVVRARALASAEAGIDRAIQQIMNQADTRGVWCTPVLLDTGLSFRTIIRNGTGIYANMVIITSEGTATEGDATVSRTVKVVITTANENVSVWNNVIFGGVGQASRSINGNVVIRGSVHLLGDGEDYTDVDGDGRWDDNESYTDSNHNGVYDFGEPYTDTDGDGHRDAREPFVDINGNGTRDPALTVTDMAEEISGTANVGNNYSGMPADLRAVLAAPPQVSFGGETVESLSAKLRVKHGKVNISGSATVGNSNSTGNPIKETLDGAYVSDGFGGNKGAASVYSDNGTTKGYDLGEGTVSMPVIDSGSYTKDGVTYATYLQYLRQNGQVHTGDLTVNGGTPLSISGPKGSLTMDASGNMTVSGIVFVDGNVSFGPAKSRITYSGSGTIVTTGSVYVHSDLVPKTGFPITDALGLVAGDKVELATGSGDAHLTMAVAMYAQHEIICNKQSDIAGTVVSSYYSMSNVPRIYQVPELANHLPPGMPGGTPIWIVSVSVNSWQEIGKTN